MFRSVEDRREDRGGVYVSAGLHVAVVALGLFLASRAPFVRSVMMPGSANGTHMLLTYSTGGAQSEVKSSIKKHVSAEVKTASLSKALPMPSDAKAAPMAEQGSGPGGLNGLGDGDMTIASVTNSPQPKPDLSSLPHGQGGNVILNAVIDAHGSITELTVVQSLNASIDQQVMETVRGWMFKPAMKNGQPVASEQEIVLHYERG